MFFLCICKELWRKKSGTLYMVYARSVNVNAMILRLCVNLVLSLQAFCLLDRIHFKTSQFFFLQRVYISHMQAWVDIHTHREYLYYVRVFMRRCLCIFKCVQIFRHICTHTLLLQVHCIHSVLWPLYANICAHAQQSFHPIPTPFCEKSRHIVVDIFVQHLFWGFPTRMVHLQHDII